MCVTSDTFHTVHGIITVQNLARNTKVCHPDKSTNITWPHWPLARYFGPIFNWARVTARRLATARTEVTQNAEHFWSETGISVSQPKQSVPSPSKFFTPMWLLLSKAINGTDTTLQSMVTSLLTKIIADIYTTDQFGLPVQRGLANIYPFTILESDFESEHTKEFNPWNMKEYFFVFVLRIFQIK